MPSISAASPALSRALLAALLCTLPSACQGGARPTEPVATAEALASPSAAPPRSTGSIHVWWVDALEPGEPGSSAQIEQVLGDLPAGPTTAVVVKPAYGNSGITAFLRSTAIVAPERLPDLAVLPLSELRAARESGLLQSLPLVEDSAADSFAFADERSGRGSERRAIPIALNLMHAIGREVAPPERWADLAGIPGAMVMPLGGSSPPELAALLSTYAGAGGRLGALPEIEIAALERSADRLAGELAAGRLRLPENGRSPRAAWNSFAASDPALALVDGGSVVGNQAGYPGMTWAPLPGEAGAAPPLAWGWALVRIKPDPERQAEVTALAEALAEALAAGPITAAGWLPARREDWVETMAGAFDPAPDPDYLGFLADQLDAASLVDGDAELRAAWGRLGAALAAGSPAESAVAGLLGP